METKNVLFTIFAILIFITVIISSFLLLKEDIGPPSQIYSKGETEFSSLSSEQNPDDIYMVSHSEYWSGEEGQIITRLLDYQGQPYVDADCTMTVLYPNRTYFINAASATFDIDSYYYKFTTPDTEGVYQYRADCYYLNNTKSRSVMNSFHLSPALNFEKIMYDDLSNQITNLSNTEAVHFGTLTVNLSQIRADTDYIRNNMQTSSDAIIFQNSVISQLNSISNFCGDNVTSSSLLCQWVNQSRNMIIDVNITVNQLNNYTQNVIYPAIISVNQSINESLTIMINLLEEKFLSLQFNITLTVNQSLTNRFDDIDNSLALLHNETLAIEYKLDCNNTVNIICDRLTVIEQNITQTMINIDKSAKLIEQVNQSLSEQIIIVNENVVTINNTVNQVLYNLSSLYYDVAYIIENIGVIENNQQYILDNITFVQNQIYDLWFNISNLPGGSGNLTEINYTITVIHEEVIKIEAKLDCNNSINVVCDRLDVMNNTLNTIEIDMSTVKFIVESLRYPSEIDLLLDGVQNDRTRTVGYVNISAEMVSPETSNGTLSLYINNVLNFTSYNYTSINILLYNGTYIIKTKFDGDWLYAPSTESYVLTIQSGNIMPTAQIITPLPSEVINLPYNITFVVTDDNPDNVTLSIYSSGTLNKTLVTGLSNSATNYIFSDTVTEGYYDLVLTACEIGTYDLFCVNDTKQIYVNLSCVPQWNPLYGACDINNTKYVEYIDLNICNSSIGLPVDNGTYVYCDYCVPVITGPFYLPAVCPINETRLRYYIDTNRATCCDVTLLISDCRTDYPPYDNVTASCVTLETAITVTSDSEPYLSSKMDVIADMNVSNSTKCYTYVKSENGILQTNPKKTDYSDSLIMAKPIETREYFTPVMGKINAYYTDENLMVGKEFILGVSCSLDNGTTVAGEQYITPQYNDLRESTARSVWFVNEMPILIGIIALVLVGIWIARTAFKGK